MDVKDVCPGHTVLSAGVYRRRQAVRRRRPCLPRGWRILRHGAGNGSRGDAALPGIAKKRIEGPTHRNPNASDNGGRRQALGKRGPYGLPSAYRLDGSRFRLGCLDAYQAITQAGQMYLGQLVSPPVYHGGRCAKIADIGRKRKIEYMENAQRPLRGPFLIAVQGCFSSRLPVKWGKTKIPIHFG